MEYERVQRHGSHINRRDCALLLLAFTLTACTAARTCYRTAEATTEGGQVLVVAPCPEAATASPVRGYTK